MKNKIAMLTAFVLIGLGMAILTGIAVSWQTQSVTVGKDKIPAAIPSSSSQVQSAMAGLPLYFIENRGQADGRSRFSLRGGGGTVHLTEGGLLFDFLRIEKTDPEQKHSQADRRQGRRLVVGLDFAGANPHPEIDGQVESKARFNYLIGNDRSKWVTDVPSYGEVVYRDVYPAVDLRLYDDNGLLRYDFIVRPGGRVEDIRLGFRGIDGLRLDQGELVAATEFGEMRQSKPVIYQETSQGRVNISGSFTVNSGFKYGFAVGAYDRARPLVIDPQVMTLGYSTFLGGGSNEQANDINWDSAYIFVTGQTISSGFPTTTGAYDESFNSVGDAFVAKIDPSATGAASLVWCTFIGGSDADIANGIDVYGDEAYITGSTYSSDFPVANQGFLNYNDGSDIFVTRLNSAGSGLLASVCLGHVSPYTGNEWGNGISVSTPIAVWICGGTTWGPTFYPLATNRQTHGSLTFGDAFMVQVNMGATPAALADIMVFGGTGGDEALAIAQDNSRIYLTGYTSSTDFPVTAGAYQTTFQGSLSDGFVFKSDFGGGMIYSTYLGTSLPDKCTGVAIGSGGAYVCGYGYGTFPAGFASNGFDDTRTHMEGYMSGFMARIHDDGGSLDYATYIETTENRMTTMARDIQTGGVSRSDCWVTGMTDNTLYGIPEKNYYQDHRGMYDAFVTRYDTSASGADSCLFVSHIGGGVDEDSLAVAGYNGSVVVAGWTESGAFPVSAGAFDSSHNGGKDVFVTMLNEPPMAITTNAATDVYSPSATLNATLTSKATVNTVSLRFQYATTSDGPYTTLSEDLYSGGVPYDYSRSISGLTPNTDYYFRVYVYHVMYGFVYGSELSFTTPAAAAPTLTTTAASAITTTTASSGGNVTAMGSDPVTARGVCWNTGGSPTTADSHTSDGSGTGTFTSSLTGLSSGTLYYVRAYATNVAGIAYGNEVTFTTLQVPTVTTQAVDNITSTSALGHGNLTALGNPNPTAHGVCWNTTGTPTLADSSTNNGAKDTTGTFFAPMISLSPYTTYYVRAYATNNAGTAYGNEVSFTTLAVAPTVTTQAVTSIYATGATGNGTITSLGVPNPTAHGVCWNTTGTPTVSDGHSDNGAAAATGAFTTGISGLTAGTTYYVRAFATNTAGTSYGGQVSFTTVPPAPVATAATSVTGSSFQANWNAAATATGYRLDVSTSNTFASFIPGFNNLDVGNVTSQAVSGLSGGTTYYYRLRAVNASGTSADSNSITVLTVPAAPVATAATSISETGFTANWNAATGAAGYRLDVSLSNTFASFVSGYNNLDVGNVTTYPVSGLSGSITYYYRLRAVNASGTSADSNTITVLTVPSAPVATAATNVTGSSFQANWNTVLSATGYRLDVALDWAFTSMVPGYNNLDVGNVTLRAVSGLSTGTTYYYRVRAVNASGTSANSNWIEVITVPGVPVATAATAITASGFTANFNAVTGASDYYLDVALDSAFTSFVPGFQNLDIGLTSYPVPGLTAGTPYYYRVRAYNGSGTSGYSNVISVWTLPAAPVATAATNVTGSSFQANWNAVVSATGYHIDVASDGAFTAILPSYSDFNAGNALNLAVTGLSPNTPYYYRVRAYNASGSSANSNVITLTTLQVHTVTFTCTAGGWLSGTLTQTIDHGGSGSPVTANPNDGYHFTGWSGTGGFSSGDNPLTVTNVLTDMIITASFANAAPLVRIVEPVQNQNVWGMVTIQAEASDDLAVQSIQFYVDGAAPLAAAAFSAAAAGKDDAALQLQSGELNVDFQGADILMLDARNHLRKATFQGDLQPVISGDFALRELAVSGTKYVHLLFVEPRRLDDGQTYSWVLCNLNEGTIQGINCDPALPASASNAPVMQFDAAGNGYYFTADGQGSMILVRQLMSPVDGLTAGTTTALTSAAGQQLRDWLVLPDGTVLLAFFEPQKAQLAYFKIGSRPGHGHPLRRRFCGRAAGRRQPGRRDSSIQGPRRLSVGFDRYRTGHERMAGLALGKLRHPGHRDRRHGLGARRHPVRQRPRPAQRCRRSLVGHRGRQRTPGAAAAALPAGCGIGCAG